MDIIDLQEEIILKALVLQEYIHIDMEILSL